MNQLVKKITAIFPIVCQTTHEHTLYLSGQCGCRKKVVPEKLMYRDDYKWLASQSTELLLNEEKRQRCIDGLKEVTSSIGSPGASAKVADEALSFII
jgi:hypothetical protein